MVRVFLAVACLLVVPPGEADPAVMWTNIVANGDLEIDADDDGWPDGWTTAGHPATPHSACVATATTAAWSGDRAIAVSVPHGGNCDLYSEPLAVAPGQFVRASMWSRSDHAAVVPVLTFWFYDSSEGFLGSYGTSSNPHSMTWREHSGTYVVPPLATFARVHVDVAFGSADTAYMDAFQVAVPAAMTA